MLNIMIPTKRRISFEILFILFPLYDQFVEHIPLTAKEHDLLSALYRNAGRIVTIDALLLWQKWFYHVVISSQPKSLQLIIIFAAGRKKKNGIVIILF